MRLLTSAELWQLQTKAYGQEETPISNSKMLLEEIVLVIFFKTKQK